MFAKQIDADPEHYFLRDYRLGFNMVFIRKGMKGTRENPAVPHWMGRCGDATALEAMCRWTGARRDSWQEWGELAERIGHEAFAGFMDELLQREPLEVVQGALLAIGQDCRDLILGETLIGGNGFRNDILHVHRFSDDEACERFFERCMRRGDLIDELLALGWSKGGDAVSTQIERLSATMDRRKRSLPSTRRAA